MSVMIPRNWSAFALQLQESGSPIIRDDDLIPGFREGLLQQVLDRLFVLDEKEQLCGRHTTFHATGKRMPRRVS